MEDDELPDCVICGYPVIWFDRDNGQMGHGAGTPIDELAHRPEIE